MAIGRRIKEARLKKSLTQEELAKMVGVTKGAIANYENNTSHPKENVMYALINALGVDANFLFQDFVGTKKAPSYSEEALKLAEDYDGRMDDRGRETVRSVADLEVARFKARTAAALRESRERSEAAEEIAPETTEMLVYINPAAAGTPLYAESDFERMTFPSDKVPRGTDFGIRISGRSMEPTVMDGSIAWVRKQLDMPNGTVGIFMLNDSAACKRFFKEADGSVRLESDNPEFGPATVAEFDTLVTVGEVIGTVRSVVSD